MVDYIGRLIFITLVNILVYVATTKETNGGLMIGGSTSVMNPNCMQIHNMYGMSIESLAPNAQDGNFTYVVPIIYSKQ